MHWGWACSVCSSISHLWVPDSHLALAQHPADWG